MTYQVTLELTVTYQDKVLVDAISEDEAGRKADGFARAFGFGADKIIKPVSKLTVKTIRPYNEKLAEFCRERNENEI